MTEPSIDDTDLPEAASPRPPLVIYTRVTQNPAADDMDGGTLVLTRIAGQNAEVAANVPGCNVVVSALHDAFLRTFPWKSRTAKQARPYRITIEEVSWDDVPPDPNAEPELFNAAHQRVDRHGNLVG